MFDELLAAPPWSVRSAEKAAMMLDGLNVLSALHYEKCEPYRRIIDKAWGGPRRYERLQDIPYLPVSKAIGGVGHEAHELLGWAMLLLVVLHVAGALRHHLILRDGVLARMIPALER